MVDQTFWAFFLPAHVLLLCTFVSICLCSVNYWLHLSFIYKLCIRLLALSFHIVGQFSLTLLRGGSKTDIPTGGSGRVSVTDISNSPGDEGSGLLCQYQAERYNPKDDFRWGVGRRRDLVLIPKLNLDTETDYLGWVSQTVHSAPYLGMKLYRVADVTAKESYFICNHKDERRSTMIGIFYPSEYIWCNVVLVLMNG